ncbi:MAG: hypothetical protein MRK01_05465 [Candidatus Scalindua sp.]|nr:hypothetical protein [Candidatus Scalindua sp.]
MENTEKEQVLSEIISTQPLPDSEAFDTLWRSMIKIAGVMTGSSECNRQSMGTLFAKLSDEEIKRLLKDRSVDTLIFQDPPLETLLADPEEKPDGNSIMRIIGKLRSSRDSDFREALINLGEVIKRVHEKFRYVCTKEPGDGDSEILSSARKILYLLAVLVVSKLN